MATEEKYFPRGSVNTVPLKPKSTCHKVKREKPLVLFKKKPSAKKKNTSSKQKFVNSEHKRSTVKLNNVSRLTYEGLHHGLLVAGCIQSIHSTSMTVNLPGHILGLIKIDKISHPYCSLLSSYSKGSINAKEIPTLNDLFRIGELVTCCVEEVIVTNRGSHKVLVSLNPSDINKNKTERILEDNVVLIGAIKSKEDHGYGVDLGIDGVTAFLPFRSTISHSDLENYDNLSIGKVIRVAVKKVLRANLGITTVELTLDSKVILKGVPRSGFNINNLTPGQQMNVFIKQIVPNGVEVSPVHAFEDYCCYTHITYLPDVWGNISELKPGKVFPATFLYAISPVNILYFSLKTYSSESNSSSLFKDGAIINNAKVIAVAQNIIILQLGAKNLNAKGFVSSNQFEGSSTVSLGQTCRTRVLHYDILENTFICSLRNDVLTAEIFSCKELNLGQIVNCTVIGFKEGFGLNLKVGMLKAFAPLTHLSDHPHRTSTAISSLYKINSSIKAKVLHITDENGVILTLKPTLLSSESLCNYGDAVLHRFYYGTICKIINSGVIVRFYGNTKGFVPNRYINSTTTGFCKESFRVGQVIRCYVVFVKASEENLILSLTPNPDKGLKLGRFYNVEVTNSNETGLEVQVNDSDFSGFIPIQQITDHNRLVTSLKSFYCSEKTIQGAVLYSFSEDMTPLFSLRSSVKAFVKDNPLIYSSGLVNLSYANFSLYVPACINKVEESGIHLNLTIPGFNDPIYLSQENFPNNLHKINFQENQVLMTLVEPEDSSLKLSLSYEDHKMTTGLEILEDLVNQAKKLQTISVGEVKQVKIQEVGDDTVQVKLSRNVTGNFRKELCSRMFKKNQKIFVSVLWQDPITQHLFVHPDILAETDISACSRFNASGSVEKVRVLLILEEFIVGVILTGIYKKQLTFIPRKSHFNDFNCKKPSLGSTVRVVHWKFVNGIIISDRDKRIKGLANLFGMDETLVKCKILDCTKNKRERKQKKKLKSLKEDLEETIGNEEKVENLETYNKLKNCTEESKALDNNNCRKRKLLASDRDGINVVTPEKKLHIDKKSIVNGNSSELENLIPEMNYISEENRLTEIIKKKSEKSSQSYENCVNGIDENEVELTKTLKSKKRLSKSHENNEIEICCADKNSVETKPRLLLPGSNCFLWNVNQKNFSVEDFENKEKDSESDSDQDDGSEDKTDKKSKKIASKESEKQLRFAEQQLMDAEKNPQSLDHFERLVLAQPNNSLIWVKYMAYHLQATEIEKARAVALRALKVISHREEQERLNVWVSLLNLENLYGSEESLKRTIDEAVRSNDEYHIYMKMAEIYSDSNKNLELDRLTSLMVKKFKTNLECWLLCCRCLLKSGLADKARALFQRGLQNLLKKEHVPFITRFALMENSFGSKEQSQTLMEHVLTTYPNLVSTWITYVDMLTKSGDINLARNVLERAASQKLPVKKMKTLYKKWLQFEEQHGSEKSINHVREAAENYINSLTATIDAV